MSKRLDPLKCWVDSTTIGFGTTVYALFHKESPMLLGMVWGTSLTSEGANIWSTYQSFVPEWARRRGVRSMIDDAILLTHHVIHTGGMSDEGRAYMKSAGYKKSKRLGLYVRVRE